MSGKQCNGWLEGRLRFIGAIILTAVTLTATVSSGIVLFAWRSQAAQDREISRNREEVGKLEKVISRMEKQSDRIERKVDTVLLRLGP